MYQAYLTPFRTGTGELIERSDHLNLPCEANTGDNIERHHRSYPLPNGSSVVGRLWPLPLAENRISRTHGEINFSEAAGVLTITAKSMNPIFVKTLPIKTHGAGAESADTQSVPLIRGPSQLTPSASQDSSYKTGMNTSIISDKSSSPAAPFSPLQDLSTPLTSPTKKPLAQTPILHRGAPSALPGAGGGSQFGIPSLNAGVSHLLRVASQIQHGGGFQIRGIVEDDLSSQPMSSSPAAYPTPSNSQRSKPAAPQPPAPMSQPQQPTLIDKDISATELGILESKTAWTTVLPDAAPYVMRYAEPGIHLLSFIGVHGGPQYQVTIIKIGSDSEAIEPTSLLPTQEVSATQVVGEERFAIPSTPVAKNGRVYATRRKDTTHDNDVSLDSTPPHLRQGGQTAVPSPSSAQVTPKRTLSALSELDEDMSASGTPNRKRKAVEMSPVPLNTKFSDLSAEALESPAQSGEAAKKRKEKMELSQEPHRMSQTSQADSQTPPQDSKKSVPARAASRDVMPPPMPKTRQLFDDSTGDSDEDDDAMLEQPILEGFEQVPPDMDDGLVELEVHQDVGASVAPTASVAPPSVIVIDDDQLSTPPPRPMSPAMSPPPGIRMQESRLTRMDVVESLPMPAFAPNPSAFMDTDQSPPQAFQRGSRLARNQSRFQPTAALMEGVSELRSLPVVPSHLGEALQQQAVGMEVEVIAVKDEATPEGMMITDPTLSPVHHRSEPSLIQLSSGPEPYFEQQNVENIENGTAYDNIPRLNVPVITEENRLKRADTMTPSIDLTQLRVLQTIGSGSCGEVYKATWLGLQVAVKKVFRSLIHENALKEFQAECNIMKRLRHPNIVLFLGITKPPEHANGHAHIEGGEDIKLGSSAHSLFTDSLMCLVTEFMPLGSLHDVLMNPKTSVDLMAILKMATDSAMGVNYLHQFSPPIIHRDLKSHNLLVGDGFVVKVTDFGLAKITNSADDAHLTFCGTLPWAAPEVLSGAGYTVKADVYSFGVVLWELITRQEPYKGLHKPDIIVGVVNNGLRPPLFPDMEPLIVELIVACWAQNPDERPDFQQIVDRLTEVTDYLYSLHQHRKTTEGASSTATFPLHGSRWLASHAPGSLDHQRLVQLSAEAHASPEAPELPSDLEHRVESDKPRSANHEGMEVEKDDLTSSRPSNHSRKSNEEFIKEQRLVLEQMNIALQAGDMALVLASMDRLRATTETAASSSVGPPQWSSRGPLSSSGVYSSKSPDASSHQSSANLSSWTLDLNELTSIARLPDEPSPSFSTRSRYSLTANGDKKSNNNSLTLTSTTNAILPPSDGSTDSNNESPCTSWHGTFRGQDVLVRVWHDALEQSEVREFHKQLNILAAVKSSRIGLFFGCVLEPRLLMVTEYTPQPTVYRLMIADPTTLSFTFDWDVVIAVALEVAKAISSLHLWQPCIVHRDIQSSKFVVDPRTWQVKMNELGLARFATASNQSTLAKVRGNFLYTAPETYSGAGFATASDVYSFGVVLWELVMRCIVGHYVQPFSEFTNIRFEFQLINQLSKEAIRPSLPPETPAPLSQLIGACWHQDAQQRPTIQDVVGQLQQLKELYEQETRNTASEAVET